MLRRYQFPVTWLASRLLAKQTSPVNDRLGCSTFSTREKQDAWVRCDDRGCGPNSQKAMRNHLTKKGYHQTVKCERGRTQAPIQTINVLGSILGGSARFYPEQIAGPVVHQSPAFFEFLAPLIGSRRLVLILVR
jgi:hypothetical protein